MENFSFLVFYFFLTIGGMIFLKKGGDSLALRITKNHILEIKIGIITALGFLLYFSSFIAYQKLLGVFNLSLLVPLITGVNQIIVAVIGIVLFKEYLNKYNIMGLIILIVGIVFISI